MLVPRSTSNSARELNCVSVSLQLVAGGDRLARDGLGAVTDRETSSRKIRILVVDNQPLIREGLKSAFARYRSTAVVGEASDTETAVANARRLSPDVILLGAGTDRHATIESIQALRTQASDGRILIIGGHSRAEFVLDLLRAGASGYVLDTSATSELLRAIRTVRRGEVFLSPTVARTLAKEDEKSVAVGSTREAPSELSPRESQVLGLIAKGLTNRQIGESLGISTRTVETHRERIMRKLDIHTVAGLTRYAIQHGFNEEI